MPGSRTVLKSSIFPASPEAIWEKLQHLGTLQHIARPYAKFTPINQNTGVIWREGERYRFRLRLFCIIPFGIHIIDVIKMDYSSYEILTNEFNTHVPVWNHRIFLRQIDNNTTEYTDEVEIYAGWKTIFVYLWAKLFYAHRQRKWIKLLGK